MTRPLLSDVLEALVGSIVDTGEHRDAISGQGIVVSSAEIDIPIEGILAHGEDGPLLRASPPFGTMRTGFDMPAHRARMVIVESRSEEPG